MGWLLVFGLWLGTVFAGSVLIVLILIMFDFSFCVGF